MIDRASWAQTIMSGNKMTRKIQPKIHAPWENMEYGGRLNGCFVIKSLYEGR